MNKTGEIIFFILILVWSVIACEPQSLKENYTRQLLVTDSLKPVDSLLKNYSLIKNDTLKKKRSFLIADHFYYQNDSLRFRHWNRENLRLSNEIKDNLGVAESYRILANFLFRNNVFDSSYYYYNRSLKIYEELKDEVNSGKVLINMATIQRNSKDFVGSEVATMKAIRKLKPLGQEKLLYHAYNNLGIIYNELGEYTEGLRYHKQALNYEAKLQNGILKASTLNNIGVIFEGKASFSLAIENYKEALQIDSLFHKNPRLYAMLLDNLAYAKFRQNSKAKVMKMFHESLAIRDSINHEAGIVINKIHLGEYHVKRQDTLKALKYINEASELSRKSNNYQDLLKSLMILSDVDRSNSESYLKEYIAITEDLNKEERIVRNKFARIRFETDEFIAENRYLSEQRKWIIGGAGSAVFMVLLIFVIWRQKSRNKKLELEKAQQKANEEIYNLLLTQQNKLEEGRHQEKERISKELHDGVLGRLFGTRLMLESLFGKSDPESLANKKKYLNDLRIIEEEVRTISHELNKEFFSPKQSFLDVLREYLKEQEKIGKFELVFINDGQISWDEFSNEIKINVFRIFQEAINNINKHADANLVSITCNKSDDRIEVVISDNGKGFEVGERRKGIGLNNIQSRILRLNGQFNLSSGKKGTQLELKIPIKYYE